MEFNESSIDSSKNDVIRLPEETSLVSFLKDRLDIYQKRRYAAMHVDFDHYREITQYKAGILEELLKNGEVDSQKIKERIIKINTDDGTKLITNFKNDDFEEAYDDIKCLIEKTNSERLTKKISSIKNFDNLLSELWEIDGIWGSKEFFTSDRLIYLVNEIKDGILKDIMHITNGAGLRDKVEELLKKNKKKAKIKK